ncbi:MAG: primosomal protein N', partial [Pseudomonadota bacterium]|nr:primosomal protein N' [Pseudomonadota bacterium]
AERELTERKKSLWPPFSKIALIRASAPKRADAHAFLALAHQLAGASSIDNVRLLGPVRAPMERRAGRYRAQLLLQSVDRRSLHAMLAYLRTKLEGSKEARRVRWSVDVDPIELF